jgi:uncharacterized membrane protein HdeD (DUF308 family)
VSGGGAATADVSGRWRWFVGLGILLLALGVVAWIDAMAVTIASAVVIGVTLIGGGVLQIVHSLVVGQWRGTALSLCSGILYALGGVLVMSEPPHGAATLTLLLVMTIVTGGILRVAAVLRHQRIQARALLLGGLASIVIGALIYLSLPWPGLWLLGTLIAIELFIQGGGWFYVGLLLRAG